MELLPNPNPLDLLTQAVSDPVGTLTNPLGLLTGGGQQPQQQSEDIQ